METPEAGETNPTLRRKWSFLWEAGSQVCSGQRGQDAICRCLLKVSKVSNSWNKKSK